MRDDALRSIIREKLRDGQLPQAKCQITWFGPGSGQTCVACDGVIEPRHIECECEHPDGGVLRFHRECFALWDEIRQALG